jgi:predicted O-linked N-acetylglucosamine transferase (SPINDLY family)
MLIDQGQRLESDGDLHGALRNYQIALSMSPDHLHVLNRLGLAAYRSGHLNKAEAYIRRAIEQDPKNWEYHKNLGNVFKQQRRFKAAEESLRKALALNPNFVEGHYDLGLFYQTIGKPDKALASYKRCLELEPRLSRAHNNRGLIYLGQNETLSSENSFKMAIKYDCDFAGAHLNLGTLYKINGNYQQARSCFEAAVKVAPNMPEANRCLGEILQLLGLFTDAIKYYSCVTHILPGHAADWVNLGTAYHDNQSLEKAMQCYQKALSIDSKLPQALLNAGIVHREKHQYEQAKGCFEKALEAHKEYDNALVQLVSLLIHLCDWKLLEAYSGMLDQTTRRAIAANKKPDETPFLNIIRKPDPLLNLQVAKAWSATAKTAATEWSRKYDLKSRRKTKKLIRLGYLSANYQDHPTSELILGLLKGHNRERFEVFTYSYGKNDGSLKRKEIVAACDRFRDISNLIDSDAADLIFNDRVDILIDLMGHTKGSRMAIPACRPAPVQARYLGMAGTTGANYFDYIIVDPIVCPSGHEPFYSENPVYMPNSYQVNNYANRSADITLREYGFPSNSVFVFCCFATAYKIDATVFRVWMNIMKQVPECVLWLMPGNATVGKNLLESAQLMGVDPKRIIVKKKLPLDQHLKRLQQADMALDTLAVNGAATTSDALWAGVPVLTMTGRHFASRMSESLLRSVDLPEMIAADLEQYEMTAVQLAKSPADMKRIRKKLLDRRMKTPLFNTEIFVKNIEIAFELMWKRFVNDEKPAAIEVGI